MNESQPEQTARKALEVSSRDDVERMAEEFVQRYREGERPSLEEYARRMPERADEIREALSAVVMLEGLEPNQNRDDMGATDGASPVALGPTDIPERIGNYHIVREVGRGGMGVVYEAEQLALGRRVALKVLPSHLSSNPQMAERFQREARSAAILHHTNIVPVFDVGNEDGVSYYAMQLIHGNSLGEVANEIRRLRDESRTNGDKYSNREATLANEAALSLFAEPAPQVSISKNERSSFHDVQETIASDVVRPETKAATVPHSTTRMSLDDTGFSSSDNSISASEANSAKYYRGIARLGAQAASALSYAHEKGIVHRDIKPSNLLLDTMGQIWVTDFGLAKVDDSGLTATGDVVGTLLYMSPERFRGICDGRADVYSLGMTLYELLTLQPAFQAKDRIQLIRQVTHDTPSRPRQIDPRIPRDLETIVMKAIEKDPSHRYATPHELEEDLQRFLDDRPIGARRASPVSQFFKLVQRNKMMTVATAAIVLLMAGIAIISAYSRARDLAIKELANVILFPRISSLRDEENYIEALEIAQAVTTYLPSDATLSRLIDDTSFRVRIATEPSGALIEWRSVHEIDSDWTTLGESPMERRMPRGTFHFRITKEGHERLVLLRTLPIDYVGPEDQSFTFRLEPSSSESPMVRIPGKDEFFIDKFEVTNEQFQHFVVDGGYQNEEFWKSLFPDGTRWRDAVDGFCDQSGMHGPATWRDGKFPIGQENYPVRGVSWYEAAAYAKFVGKNLPTVKHWNWAAQTKYRAAIVPLSNIGNRNPSPMRVGQYQGIGPNGTYDMAGNVNEWCWNESPDGDRYALGGSWRDPDFWFYDPSHRTPLDRSEDIGFRCSKYLSGVSEMTDVIEPSGMVVRDFRTETPCLDEEFQKFLELYRYDQQRPLNSKTLDVVKLENGFIRHDVIYDSAYDGDEQIIAYLFLPNPRVHSAPYQTVIDVPASGAVFSESSRDELAKNAAFFEFLLDAGRAVLYPVYWGTHERNPNKSRLNHHAPEETELYRDAVIRIAQDFHRSVDYLLSRDDIDGQRLAYFGYSWGAGLAPIILATEPTADPRIKAAVLHCGALWSASAFPEVDQINFTSRVRVPVQMINGKYDTFAPVDSGQKPMFDLLPLSVPDKKEHRIFETGHWVDVSGREANRWLDLHLGKVNE